MSLSALAETPTVAGFRLLRIIGRGSRGGDVWLGAALDEGAAPQQVAIKVRGRDGPSDDLAATSRELAALDRAAGDHVVALLDLEMGSSSTALVFERLAGGDLAGLIARRRELSAGEAVTILAPVASTVRRLHTAGVAHGSLTAGRVLFRGDGAPMLVGFGRAVLFAAEAPEAVVETVQAVADDRAALVALADAVLSRVLGPRSEVARRLRDRFAATPPSRVAEVIATEVFELATPVPVRFADPPPVDGAPQHDGRLVPVREPITPSPRPEAAQRRALDPLRSDGTLSAFLDRGPTARIREVLERRWAAWTPGRRRLVLGAGVGAAAVVLAVVIVPGPTTERAGTEGPLPTTAAESAVGSAPEDVDAGSAGGAVDIVEPDAAALAGDDPAAAASVLLRRRAACFSDLSQLCLDGVDQQGSAAIEDDHETIAAVLAGGELPPAVGADTTMVVTERLGDTALIDLGTDSEPASLLLMKGEAGWRIRDYIAAG